MSQTETVELFDKIAVSPFLEMGAYEHLWCTPKASYKSLAEQFARYPGCKPSDFVNPHKATESANDVHKGMHNAGVYRYGISINGMGEFPERLNHAAHPVALLYYQGFWNYLESPCVAVVGSRNPTKNGINRTRRLVKLLVKDGFTIVSGLAAGIDRAAHETAIEIGGRTIAVLGTPLNRSYPADNAELQYKIAREHLVISQVPVKRYETRDWRWNRGFFPERNKTMSAISLATIIIEAGETSGTLVQARAALHQNRKLFILDNCFHDTRLSWPVLFQSKGAIRVRDYEDLTRHVPKQNLQDR